MLAQPDVAIFAHHIAEGIDGKISVGGVWKHTTKALYDGGPSSYRAEVAVLRLGLSPGLALFTAFLVAESYSDSDVCSRWLRGVESNLAR